MKFYTLPGEQHVPALDLVTWKSAPGAVSAAVKEAIAVGYRSVDVSFSLGPGAPWTPLYDQL